MEPGTRGVSVALARGSFTQKNTANVPQTARATETSKPFSGICHVVEQQPSSSQGHLLHERPVWARRANLRPVRLRSPCETSSAADAPPGRAANCARPALRIPTRRTASLPGFCRGSLRLALPCRRLQPLTGRARELTRSAPGPRTIVPSTSHLLPSHVVAPSSRDVLSDFGDLTSSLHYPLPLSTLTITSTTKPLNRASTSPSLLVLQPRLSHAQCLVNI